MSDAELDAELEEVRRLLAKTERLAKSAGLGAPVVVDANEDVVGVFRLALPPAHRLSPLAKKSRSTVNSPILA